MAFAEYGAKSGNRTKLSPKDVTVAVSGKKTFNLCVVIGYELLRSCGLVIGDHVALFFGTEEDKGKLLIKKADRGVAISAYVRKKADNDDSKVHGQIVRKVTPVPPIEDFVNQNIPCGKVESTWDKEAGGLLVTLPPTFFVE